MSRSLTASVNPTPEGGAPTRRPAHRALGPALLAATLLLASCGGPSTPPATGGATTPGVTARGNLNVTASSEVLTTNLNAPTQLRVSGTTPAEVKVSVTGAPAGVSVSVGAGAADGAATVLPLTASGSAPLGTEVQVSVVAGGRAATLTLPVTGFDVTPLPADKGEPYAASSLSTDRTTGRVTLVASPSGSAGTDVRHSLLQFDPAARTFKVQAASIAQKLETIVSHAVTPNGSEWVSVTASTAKGVSLMNLGSGQLLRPGVSDTPSRLSVTPDGALWFMAPSVGALLRLDPASGTFERRTMDPDAGWLTAAPGGQLYLARSGAAPAVLRYDPASSSTRPYPVTLIKSSQPSHLTAAPDGTLWFIEGTTSTVIHLDPSSGKQTPLALPGDARPAQLAALPDGTLWVMDGREKALHRVQGGKVTLSLPLPRGAAGQVLYPSALGGTADSRLLFEAGGQLYMQQ